jgi:exosortase A
MENINNKTKYHKYFIALLLLWFVVYFLPLKNLVTVWLGSETYTYCFFIVPIVLYLIYEKKNELAAINYQITWWPLIPLFITQAVYLLADLSGISVITQLAAYGSLLCLVALVYGNQLVKAIIFPLFYMVLAVPMGEELMPALQNVTANISVYLVQLVGIPVYREGLFIYIPNGTFQVAEACSGIRFLIAMIAIGLLYAYMFYRSNYRRIIFVVISLVLPVIANGIRAFGIIYIGHKTDMEYATGADHIIYGWLFFSIVLILLISIGKMWREDDQINSNTTLNNHKKSKVIKTSTKHANISFVLASLLLLIQPIYQYQIIKVQTNHTNNLPNEKSNPPFWGPTFYNTDSESVITENVILNNQQINITVYRANYLYDNHEKELINSGNRFFDIDRFSIKKLQNVNITLQGKKIAATHLTIVNAAGQSVELLYWYRVGNTQSSHTLAIKKAQLFDKLTGGPGGGEVIILSINQAIKNDEMLNNILKKIPRLVQ